jgi:protein TonB
MKEVMKIMKTTILTIILAFAALTAMAQTQSDTQQIISKATPVPVNLNEVVRKIDYPVDAIANNIEGRVVYRVFVDEKGQYRCHYVSEASNPALTRIAESYLADLKFEPAQREGKSVEAWVNIPFKFEIRP